MMQEDAVRRELETRLKDRFTEKLWSYLFDMGFVEDVINGAEDADYLEGQARRVLEVGRQLRPPPVNVARSEGPTAGEERAWALSQLASAEARDDPDVVRFRRTFLDGRILQWTAVNAWVQERAGLDGPVTRDLTVVLRETTSVSWEPGQYRIDPPLHRIEVCKISARTLDYAGPDDEWVRRVRVAAGGILDKLRVLAESLAKAYAWTPAQATVFILTGVTPLISTVRVETSGFKIRHGKDHGWSRRIVLDIDPAATPDEVMAAYQRIRREQNLTRMRPLTPKHARLAAFAGAEHVHKPWSERLRLWNTSFPHWSYNQESNFRRDAGRAQARIMYPGQLRGSNPLGERGMVKH